MEKTAGVHSPARNLTKQLNSTCCFCSCPVLVLSCSSSWFYLVPLPSWFFVLNLNLVLQPACYTVSYPVSSQYIPFVLKLDRSPAYGAFPGGSNGKESACNAGDPGSTPGSGRSPGEGNGNSLQYSCLENPMGRGAWWATVHGVVKNWTWLSN